MVTATSVSDSTKSISASITITSTGPPPPPILSDGTYVFHFSGQDFIEEADSAPYFVAGAFTVKNGVITAGEQDYLDYNGAANDQLVPSNCSISTAGGNIQIVLATGDNQIGINGVETLRGTIVSPSRVLVSQFDTFAVATGSIDLQTSTATPPQGYAFVLSGLDGSINANQVVIGGILNFNGSSLSTASSVFDYNDGGNVVLSAQSFDSGSITTPDSFGRITISLNPNAASNIPSFVLTGYLVGGRVQLLESQSDDMNGDIGGTALAQGSNTGQFSQATIANSTYVHGSAGEDSNNPLNMAGSFIFAPLGAVSGRLAWNDFTFHTGNGFSGATYAVDPTGRVTISNVIPSNLPGPINLSFQLYLDGNGNALVLGSDAYEISTGLGYVQSGPLDYEGNYAASAQGYVNGQNNLQLFGTVGPVTIANDMVNGYTDYTSQSNDLASFNTYANTPLNGTEDTADGLFMLSGLNSIDFSQSGSFGYYPIDNNRVLAIEVDGNAQSLLLLESVSLGKQNTSK
jgi:hypothetical protein